MADCLSTAPLGRAQIEHGTSRSLRRSAHVEWPLVGVGNDEQSFLRQFTDEGLVRELSLQKGRFEEYR